MSLAILVFHTKSQALESRKNYGFYMLNNQTTLDYMNYFYP